MKNKLVDFIHVGDYKTGTSWLQESIFPFHPEIRYLGDPCFDERLNKVLREMIDTRDLDFDSESIYSQLKQIINKSEKITGISREVFSQTNYITGEHALRNAQRIKSVFGSVKIIYTIREQESMLNSIYSQYLKMGGTRGFEDWFLDPIECKGIIERLKYDKNIEMYHNIFGEENVLVLLFEELKYNKKEFLRKIFSFIGCPNEEFIPKESSAVNSSLTKGGTFCSKILHKLFRNSYHNYRSSFLHLDKIIYCFLPKRVVEKLNLASQSYVIPSYNALDKRQRLLFAINMAMMSKITKLCEKIKVGGKVKIPKNTLIDVLPLFKDSNNILKNKYNLEVDKYKWTL